MANITSRDNSVKISAGASAPNGTGAVIAEVYDATPASAYTTSLPRLVNFSVIKQINAGDTLTLGFTIDGTASKTVLIRVIGPALGQFGYTSSSTLNDPQLTLYNSRSVVVSSNNDWAGNAQVAAAITATGAFPVANTASKDAMLVATLAPDGYTAQASGVGGTGGFAIVEVYEVP